MPPPFVVPIRDLLRDLESEPRLAPQIEALRVLPERPARHGDWPAALHPDLIAAAARLGVERLYSHQSLAVGAALEGRHVVTVAATASGKSLAYLLPLLDTLRRRPEARALLLFPTKALARDQLAVLEAWDAALPAAGFRPAAYDGDTPRGARSQIRREARIVVSNPDMLHAGILPQHASWASFLGGLSDLVLDEMHVYRGIFGSHVANVIRRLRRVARFHATMQGADPTRPPGAGAAGPEVADAGRPGSPGRPRFAFSSATIANPAELAERLVGAAVTVIDADGAPRGRRSFLIYNPPVVDPVLNLRRSAVLESEALARRCLAAGVQTIVFARSRQSAELLLRYLDEGLAREGLRPAPGDAMPLVRGYRGGYMAGERRAIEAALREGRLRGVVATNALELGVDIGQLDACVMSGYPGSIASTWQQAGRAGRRAGESLAILVAGASPIDQFIARHPDYLFEGSPEHARIAPDNLLILLDHLRCAAFELPFDAAEASRPFGADPGDPPVLPATRAEPSGSGPAIDAAHADAPGIDGATAAGPDVGVPAAPTVAELLAVLEAQGLLQRSGDTWYWMADERPAERVGLRGAGADAVAIVLGPPPLGGAAGPARLRPIPTDGGDPEAAGRPPAAEVLGTVERSSAPLMLHPGAVYLHEGSSYVVESLDLDEGRAYVQASDGSLYTRASSHVEIQPLRHFAERRASGVDLAQGELDVRSRATGYRRIRFRTHETLGWGDIDLPEQRHVAGGYWFTLRDETVERLRALGRWHHDPVRDRGPSWPRQALRARERDGRRCRLCNAPERADRAHDVHHIRPFRDFGWQKGLNERHLEANDLDNLITLCKACHRSAERCLGLHGGLQGLGHALGHVAPLFLMCDAGDLGVKTESHAAWSKRPTVVVFERAAAGVGFGEALFELHERLIAATGALVEGCPCPAGCPACVGPAAGGLVDAKSQVLAVLAALR
ncbi:MAG: DEAD/DEAH box helicase [Chloroflexi bacterium]|nr:DEAD/DEAH box helicase [Chloroflexota bacterium]